MESHDVDDALRDGLAVVSEWDGGTLDEKLRAAGLDPDDVRTVVEERFAEYLLDPEWSPRLQSPEAVETWAAAFAEGLLAGSQLERRSQT